MNVPAKQKQVEHYLTLSTPYTDKEMSALARKLAAVLTDIARVERDKKARNSTYNEELSVLGTSMNEIKDNIGRGGIKKSVKCLAEVDSDGRIINTIRTDTKEEVKDAGHPVLNLPTPRKNNEKPTANKEKKQ